MYTIVIPHLSSSKYIDQCKYYLEKNSKIDHEVLCIVDESDVYYAYNYGVYHSKYDNVILMNDDMIVSEGWDVPFMKYAQPDTILTGHVIEPDPGIMLSSQENNKRPIQNIKSDCGTTIDTFDYNKFVDYINTRNDIPEVVLNSAGWYMPVCVNKKTFVSYPNIGKFPIVANDITWRDYILPAVGFKFSLVKSFFYHFQRGSHRNVDI
jgi:hypothetical protein